MNSNASSSPGNFTVVETDPTQNQTVYAYSGGFATETIAYQGGCSGHTGCSGGGTQLLSTITCYNKASKANCAAPSNVPALPITQIDIYKTIGAMSQSSRLTTVYDGYGNVTQTVLYDFGASTPTETIDTPSGTYQSGTGCASIGNNIYNRLCYRNVWNGSDSGGTLLRSETYAYDSTGNMLMHVAATTSAGISGPTLTNSYTYNANGTAATSKDVNGTVTNINYGGSGGCNGLLPTSTVVAGLTVSYQWDCNGGVMTKMTDANGQNTTYAYNDPLWRLTQTTDPLGNTTTNSYTPTTSESILAFVSPASSTSTVDLLTTFDGLGRKIISQRRQGPASTTFDTVSTTYDLNGRVASVSVACTKTASLPCPVTPATTATYDGLSRPLQITDAGGGTTAYSYPLNDVSVTTGPSPTSQRQMEYDGLGRLTSLCEVTANTLWPPGTCAQNAPLTGYWTRYQYDGSGRLTGVCENTTVALGTDCVASPSATQQTRTYSYDGLNRLTSETNPEWNSLAATYIYDTDTTCGTSSGDLVKKIDPATNVTCTAFDQLHRPTSVTYPSGPNSAATPSKTFVYDSATVNNKTMLLAKGRLAEAYTGPTGSKTTDLGFSYDADGRTIDFYESTPHSSGYYDVTASYWANDTMDTLKGVGLPTLTYGPNGEGRPSTVSASSGINPVYSTTYNPAGQATDVTFGSSSGAGDPVDFGYDSNTGRMTQYKLTINGTATHGDPTWNPNGTLGSLAITDPFNASDAQTCNYGYDDMARLSSVNCLQGTTNVWNQNFTYDPFGNITKSGTISWQPGYSEGTNQYVTVANCATTGAAPCYDPDGNLLKDGTDHVYTWDADGHPVTLDSDSLVYDALGREVEVFKGGAYTEFAFGPIGKLALMNGQTQTKAFVPLPGGTQVKYAGNAISTFRLPDWLGSFRGGSNPNRTYSWGIAFAPFGEQYAPSGSPAWSFTGEEGTADTVADEYDFLARKLHSAQGRWISPDRAGLDATDPLNPQSWNRYSYVSNYPLTSVDPGGLACYAIERAITGSCAAFMDNGVNFGSNWNEFDLLENPIAVRGPYTCNGDCGYPVVGYVYGIDFGISGDVTSVFKNNTKTTKTPAQCMGAALKKNAVTLTLDAAGTAAGFLPGGGALSVGRQLATWGTQTGLSMASMSNSFYNGSYTAGFVGMSSAMVPTAAMVVEDAGINAAKVVPGLGTLVNAGQLVYDGWKTYKDYQACMGNP